MTTIFTAIEAAFRVDANLPGLCPGGIEFEVSTPGTTKPRVVFSLPDDGITDVRGYSVPGVVRTYTRRYRFLFTAYADTLDKLRQILAALVHDTGSFENAVFALDSPEISGGSRWLEDGRRIFKNKNKRNEADASYEYVGELYYESLVNNPAI